MVKEKILPLPAVKNSMNANLFPKKGEKNFQPSLTQPDQSMTVKELVERHVKGLPYDINARVPLYEGEVFMPDIEHMDLADREAFLLELNEQLSQVQAEAERKRKADLDAQDEARIQAEIEKRLNAIKQAKNDDPRGITDVPFDPASTNNS